MDESAVFGHVIDELEIRDYQPLVHVAGSHRGTYAETRSHSGAISEYDAEVKPWILRAER